jgi:hypothetical protein
MQPGEAGVAFWAHVGGFLSGMALVLVLRPPGVSVLQARRTAPFAMAERHGRFGAGSVPQAGRRNPPDGWS